jgi:hypothetical protein
MRKIIRKAVRQVLKLDFFWWLCYPVVKAGTYLQYQRNAIKPPKTKQKPRTQEELEIIELLGKPVVKAGPFKGLRYPDFTSFGSQIFPKINGSYENEIAGIVESLCCKKFSEIIDIGCAEGYYAVGFALRIPESKVYAYDINPDAQNYCRRMAELNGVTERVQIEEKCTSDLLSRFDFTGKGLIISDCEGAEKELFTESNKNNLANCDMLIETHDFIDITISGYLKDLFSDTHQIKVIQSVDDIMKTRIYKFDKTEDLDLSKRMKIFSEGRPGLMEWLYLEPKIA